MNKQLKFSPILAKDENVKRIMKRTGLAYEEVEFLYYEWKKEYMLSPSLSAIGSKLGSARKVKCIETGLIYPSIVAAGKATSCNHQNIAKNCQGLSKSCKGLHFEYAD